MNPYQPPATASPGDPPESAGPGEKATGSRKLRQFISLSGSYSRAELLVATLVLGFLAVAISAVHTSFPAFISSTAATVLTYGLYPVWGVALGKRSRDLGTTFTYGMIVGMLFPLLGLIFLFQPGSKAKAKASRSIPQAAPAGGDPSPR